jgi:hypothetical protein
MNAPDFTASLHLIPLCSVPLSQRSGSPWAPRTVATLIHTLLASRPAILPLSAVSYPQP